MYLAYSLASRLERVSVRDDQLLEDHAIFHHFYSHSLALSFIILSTYGWPSPRTLQGKVSEAVGRGRVGL